MPGVVRKGDINTAGGAATRGIPRVLVNGRPVVVPDVKVTPHPCCPLPRCIPHCIAVTGQGSTTVFAGGKPIVYEGSPDSCGHPRDTHSPDVNVGR